LPASYYQPPTAGKFKLDAPLGPKGCLTIGYGCGGSGPFRHFLRDGEDIAIGFLKLFLTTEPVDLSNIPQSSPFRQDGQTEQPPRHQPSPLSPLVTGIGDGLMPPLLKKKMKMTSTWDTITVPVVQRKANTQFKWRSNVI
jgi:hypothetical protein